jgi:hypothetical protein
MLGWWRGRRRLLLHVLLLEAHQPLQLPLLIALQLLLQGSTSDEPVSPGRRPCPHVAQPARNN